jgi:hypothetical protein
LGSLEEEDATEEDLVKAPEKLKKDDYEAMRVMDSTKELDPSLKIGTGDDELVEKIVKTAKTGMGVVGTFIPDEAVSKAVKQNTT